MHLSPGRPAHVFCQAQEEELLKGMTLLVQLPCVQSSSTIVWYDAEPFSAGGRVKTTGSFLGSERFLVDWKGPQQQRAAAGRSESRGLSLRESRFRDLSRCRVSQLWIVLRNEFFPFAHRWLVQSPVAHCKFSKAGRRFSRWCEVGKRSRCRKLAAVCSARDDILVWLC